MTARLSALTNAPGFSILVITVLAFGIGAATAFFSVVDAILFQPLRSDTAGRIVAIQTSWPRKSEVTPHVSGGDFLDLRSSARCFSALAVYNGGELGVQVGRVQNGSVLLLGAEHTSCGGPAAQRDRS